VFTVSFARIAHKLICLQQERAGLQRPGVKRKPGEIVNSQMLTLSQVKPSMLFQLISGQVEPSLVDKVFTLSAHLNSEAIVDFVQALSRVSELVRLLLAAN